jgi:hypothetical protein
MAFPGFHDLDTESVLERRFERPVVEFDDFTSMVNKLDVVDFLFPELADLKQRRRDAGSRLNFRIREVKTDTMFAELQYADFEEVQEEAIPCHSRRGIKRESTMTHS